MKIYRILNNNAVIILNPAGEEEIVCGKGVGFQKKIGDTTEYSPDYKVFKPQNNDVSARFENLMREIPLGYIQLADDLISYAKLHIGHKLNENLILSLSDHIYTTLERYKNGYILENVLLLDIKRFYSLEYEIGQKALKEIDKRFGISLPDDEAGFIAIHFVNAQTEGNAQDIHQITLLMQEICNIVKYYFKVSFNEDGVYYYRFTVHLKFFAHRVLEGKQYQDQDASFLEIIAAHYPVSYDCVTRIDEFISSKYHYSLSYEEKAYLTIHIERLIYKSEDI